MFGEYRTVIPTREEWDKAQLAEGRSGSHTEPVMNKGLVHEFANIKAKCNGTSHWDRMLQPFRQRLQQYWTV